VITLCLLDGLEIGGPCHPTGGEQSGIERIPFRGAESGALGLSTHRQELRPPRLRSIGYPLRWGGQGELRRNCAWVGAEPDV